MRAKDGFEGRLMKRQGGMTVIGMLLILVMLGFIAVIAMKVVPMYIQYFSIKSTVESVRKEPQLAQMSPQNIHDALQKRFDIGYIENIKARDLKIRNESGGRVLDLVYQDERELFYGLFVVLKVEESVSLNP